MHRKRPFQKLVGEYLFAARRRVMVESGVGMTDMEDEG